MNLKLPGVITQYLQCKIILLRLACMALNGMTSLYISTSSPVLPLRGLELQAHRAAFEEEGGRRDSSVASTQTTVSFLLGPEA